MKTVGDRIVIEPLPVVNETAGGLLLQKSRQLPQKGTVIACGPDVVVCKAGDIVFYNKGAGASIIIEGKDYTYMRENDLFAIL